LRGSVYLSTLGALHIPMAPIVTATVGTDGNFSVTTRPGNYILVGTSPQYQGGRATCYAKGHFALHATEVVVANVYCEET
jgi:hypothetical protein